MKSRSRAFDDDAISSDSLVFTRVELDAFARKVIAGGSQDDKLNGTNGKDRIDGGTGNDNINGLGGVDTLIGGAGNDTLNGGKGDDILTGGAGKDRLIAGIGEDRFSGGSGVDTAVFGGDVSDYEASYDKNGRLVLAKSGSKALLDHTVELMKFGDTTIDRGIVDTPVITSATAADGVLAPGGTTTDSTLVINGTSDPFARLVVYDGSVKIGVAVAGADGVWSFDATHSPLSNGAHAFTVTASYGDHLPAVTSAGATFTINAASYLVDLTTLSPSQGFVMQGEAVGDSTGWSASSAGDVNGDGFNDIIIGALGNDRGGKDSGAAFVVFGKAAGFGTYVDGRLVFDLSGLTAAQGFIIQGGSAGDWAGNSVSSAGDVNGDGFDDLIVGAPKSDAGGDMAGAAYVIFGTASGFGATVAGQRVLDMNTLSASQGFIIKGDTAGDEAGWSVSSAGDVNGDGFGDVIVGAVYGDDGGDAAGEAYVIFGRSSGFGSNLAGQRVIDLTSLTESQGFLIQGLRSNPDAGDLGDWTGYAVSAAGDLNGDGFDDVLVGAPYNSSDHTDGGRAYVIYGTASGFGTNVAGRQVIDLAAITTTQGTYLSGADYAQAGSSVSAAGDVNGDGFDDFIAGAVGLVEAYVVFGGTDLSFGFRISDKYQQTGTGCSVSSAGDINGDGFDDLIVGGDGNSAGGKYAGQAFVVFGAATGTDIDVRKMSASQGFTVQSDTDDDSAGHSVSSAGDINGDGFDDLMVGAPGGGEGGEIYILYGGAFGGSNTPINFTGTSSAEILMGAAGNDTLTGNGGRDVYRSGTGNDHIVIKDAGFRLIDAGSGKGDVVVFDGNGFALDARNFSNSRLTGIEGFDLTKGGNILKLAAVDVFHFSTNGNEQFTGADSHNNIVVDGDSGDTLQLFDTGAANADWEVAETGRTLDGSGHGAYSFVNLVEHGTDRVLASIAVDNDMTLVH
jgi:hypothetical protein